jgi:glycosyltransferase involved in cell wall biosynthesis
MRILQVNSARALGGGETHVLELSEALRKSGNDVVVAGRQNGAVNPDVHFPFLNSIDIFTAYGLRKLLKDGFDIVHAHVARDYTVTAAAAWSLPNVSVVMTRHLLYPVHRNALYRRIDGWIAPTSQILKTLTRLHPKHSTVIPNWVDLDKFPYKPHEQLHRPVNLGLLGQISPHKGHGDALEAVRLLGNDYRLLIAGKGEEPYVEDLKRRAQGLSVEFPGFVSLPDFFNLIDILLVPSWEEPFGIVLLEAMAAGIPLISTAVGGPLDIVRPDRDGVLVAPHDARALAAEARRLVANAEWRNSVVKSARERVEAEFDIRKVVPKVEQFYEELRGRRINSQ